MDYQSIITFFMEMAGTVAFAASGAMVGVERNMDIFGVSVLGVVTAVGGGMIRDIVLGIIPYPAHGFLPLLLMQLQAMLFLHPVHLKLHFPLFLRPDNALIA